MYHLENENIVFKKLSDRNSSNSKVFLEPWDCWPPFSHEHLYRFLSSFFTFRHHWQESPMLQKIFHFISPVNRNSFFPPAPAWLMWLCSFQTFTWYRMLVATQLGLTFNVYRGHRARGLTSSRILPQLLWGLLYIKGWRRMGRTSQDVAQLQLMPGNNSGCSSTAANKLSSQPRPQPLHLQGEKRHTARCCFRKKPAVRDLGLGNAASVQLIFHLVIDNKTC